VYVGLPETTKPLSGQSRLKTAPTIQKQQIQNFKVSFPIRLDAFQASGGADPPCMRYKIASVMRAGSRTKCHASMFAHHPPSELTIQKSRFTR
jgi:hypothetical protein